MMPLRGLEDSGLVLHGCTKDAIVDTILSHLAQAMYGPTATLS
jgi:hypothetical protein